MGDHWLTDPYGFTNHVNVPSYLDDTLRAISDTFNGVNTRMTDSADNCTQEADMNDLRQRLEAFEKIVSSLEGRINHLEEMLKESMPLLF